MSQKTIQLIYQWASHDELVAIEDQGKPITYSQLWHGIQNAVSLFDGVTKIGIMSSNTSEYIVLLLAALYRGMTVVPIPHFFSNAQKAEIIRLSEPEIIFACEQSIKDFADAKPIPKINFIDSRKEFNSSTLNSKKIIFTSGTTGSPKGVCLLESAQEKNISHLLDVLKPSNKKRYLSLLPFSMLLEEICALHMVFQSGSTLIIEKDFFDCLLKKQYLSIIELLEKHSPNYLMIVPDILKFWLFELEITKSKLTSSLEFVAIGGGKTPISILEQAQNFGIPVFEGYGLSEASSVVSFNFPGSSKLGSVGKPFQHHNLEIIDGEIVLHGDSLFSGYLNDSRSQDDLFFTGDLGRFDGDGFLFIDGRKDNILVTGTGRNISPEWIENIFNASIMITKSIAFINNASEVNLLVVLSPVAESIELDDLLQRLDKLSLELPFYARPNKIFTTEGINRDCFSENGKPKRKNISMLEGTFKLLIGEAV